MKYGRLTITHDMPTAGGHRMVACSCECGGKINLRRSSVVSGHTQSCGYLHRDRVVEVHTKDSLSRDARYHMLLNAIGRCHDPERRGYQDYGARGIFVCDRWRFGENGKSGIVCFCEDMGPRPTSAHTLDRRDNDGPYSPSNCRWATRREQQRNRRVTPIFEFRGRRLSVPEIAEVSGIKYPTIISRLRRGWAPAVAFTSPPAR